MLKCFYDGKWTIQVRGINLFTIMESKAGHARAFWLSVLMCFSVMKDLALFTHKYVIRWLVGKNTKFALQYHKPQDLYP